MDSSYRTLKDLWFTCKHQTNLTARNLPRHKNIEIITVEVALILICTLILLKRLQKILNLILVYKLVAGRLEINISKHQTIDDKINNVAFLIQIITTRLIIVMEHTYLLLLRKLISQ